MTLLPVHSVQSHPSGLPGVEALVLRSARAFPRHAHDQIGLGVMTAGAQRSWSLLGEVEAGAGDVVMVNPGEMHDGRPLEGAARAWRILYLDPALVGAAMREDGRDAEPLLRPVARDPGLATVVGAAIARIADEGCASGGLAVEESVFLGLLRALRHHGLDRPFVPGPRSPSVQCALERLRDAPEEAAPSLADLAALAGASRFQLLRGFAREVGATPHAYLVQLRLTLVRRHLIAGLSLAEAALAAGFADQSHMTRAFVRQFGITPGRWRAALA